MNFLKSSYLFLNARNCPMSEPTKEELEAEFTKLREFLIIATDGVHLNVVLQCLGELSIALIVGYESDKPSAIKVLEAFCVGLIRTAGDLPEEVFDIPADGDEPPAKRMVSVH
jgi:hypothetical protein